MGGRDGKPLGAKRLTASVPGTSFHGHWALRGFCTREGSDLRFLRIILVSVYRMEKEKANVEVATGFQIRNNESLPEPDSCSGKLKSGGDIRYREGRICKFW